MYFANLEYLSYRVSRSLKSPGGINRPLLKFYPTFSAVALFMTKIDNFRRQLQIGIDPKIKTTSNDFDGHKNEDNPNMTKDTNEEDDLIVEDTQK